ncbi:hypothetical protein VIGAN_10189500 [Vigna angularis var. angularis]|uniref:Uncharacterized protein n=1 Tax=Vigna angularis var. angularis TaxID=157739 RepID=A0A0S3T521_PHAAN|nr:hypothetical protein VIGAN_10189500 [Vigna angularis var. angularis]
MCHICSERVYHPFMRGGVHEGWSYGSSRGYDNLLFWNLLFFQSNICCYCGRHREQNYVIAGGKTCRITVGGTVMLNILMVHLSEIDGLYVHVTIQCIFTKLVHQGVIHDIHFLNFNNFEILVKTLILYNLLNLCMYISCGLYNVKN